MQYTSASFRHKKPHSTIQTRKGKEGKKKSEMEREKGNRGGRKKEGIEKDLSVIDV